MGVTVHDMQMRAALEQIRQGGMLVQAVDPLNQRQKRAARWMMLREDQRVSCEARVLCDTRESLEVVGSDGPRRAGG